MISLSTRQFSRFLVELAQLSPDQINEVRKRLSLLGASAKVDTPSLAHSWLLEGVRQELIRRGICSKNMRFSFALLSRIAPSLENDLKAGEEFLLSNLKVQLNEAEKMSLGRIAAEELITMLSGWTDFHLSLQSVLRNLSRVPEAMENAFPGYVSVGLQSLLIGRK